MATTAASPITFTAGEDLEAFRRVKLSGAGTKTVVYADAGEVAIGATLQNVASGVPVAVEIFQPGQTVKIEAAGAIAAEAAVYGAADGKIDDTVSGKPLGVAFKAASGSASVIEVLPLVAPIGGVEIFTKVVTDANAADVTIATVPYACLILDWWIIARDTTAANVTPKNDGTAFGAAVAKGTSADAIVRGATIVAAADAIVAGDALTVAASAVAAFDIAVLVVRTA